MKQAQRKNKYRAVKVELDGHKFDSKAEAAQYGNLAFLARIGKIKELKVHVPFLIEINGVKVCKYVCDFTYLNEAGTLVVEDVKGVKTAVYQLKKKLMLAVHGIRIKESGKQKRRIL